MTDKNTEAGGVKCLAPAPAEVKCLSPNPARLVPGFTLYTASQVRHLFRILREYVAVMFTELEERLKESPSAPYRKSPKDGWFWKLRVARTTHALSLATPPGSRSLVAKLSFAPAQSFPSRGPLGKHPRLVVAVVRCPGPTRQRSSFGSRGTRLSPELKLQRPSSRWYRGEFDPKQNRAGSSCLFSSSSGEQRLRIG